MKASEARELAQNRAKELCVEHKAIYDKVIEAIKKALAKEECYAVIWDGNLPSPVVSMLEKDGYKVKYSSWRNESQYTISWSE